MQYSWIMKMSSQNASPVDEDVSVLGPKALTIHKIWEDSQFQGKMA